MLLLLLVPTTQFENHRPCGSGGDDGGGSDGNGGGEGAAPQGVSYPSR